MVFYRPKEKCLIRTNNVPMNIKVAILNCTTVPKSTWSSMNVRPPLPELIFRSSYPEISVQTFDHFHHYLGLSDIGVERKWMASITTISPPLVHRQIQGVALSVEVRHPHYNNKQKRQAALEKLLELVTPVVSTATSPYLKTKIGGLRSTYLRERKKVKDSQRSGAGADDVYVPRLWYYDRLRFLSEHTEVRESLSTLPSTLPSTPAEASDVQPGPSSQEEVEEPSLSQEDLSQEEAVECSSQEEAGVSGRQEEAGLSVSQEEAGLSVSQEKPYKRARKATHMQDSALRLIQESSASLRALPTPEEAFACMAATKLKCMQKGQRLMCEQLIYKVLTKGVSGEITPKTE
ncbi:hypothetical protein AB205_0183200, partial [Aquarana catesbeiana]